MSMPAEHLNTKHTLTELLSGFADAPAIAEIRTKSNVGLVNRTCTSGPPAPVILSSNQ